MSEFDLAENVPVEEPAEPDAPEELAPEEYEPVEPGAVSPDTGTVYDPLGEPETTPHDEELVKEEEE